MGTRVMFLCPQYLCLQKVQMNSILVVKVEVLPPPISVLTTQTALTDSQSIILKSSPPSQNVGAKRQKHPLTRLCEPLEENQTIFLFII